jgi:hypothetical protein
MTLRSGLLLSCLLCTGCFSHMDAVTVALNDRHIQSCVWSAGFPWPFVYVRVVTVTGGATLYECTELERMLGP